VASEVILIVEDNPTNRKLIEVILRRAGFQTLSVEDGESALEVALREKPQLILMDIQLPGMNGLEATRILRAASFLAPIIALTGNESGQERDEAAAAGCTAHITKPVDPRTFPDQIRSFLTSGN
jgi:CheY-like chemotaxis protein